MPAVICAMSFVVFGLLVLIALLGVAALAVPLARRLGLPVTVLFAAFGLTYGVVTTLYHVEVAGPLNLYDRWFVERLAVDTHAILYFFLPPLLFEMAISVNVRRLLQDAVAVLVMAILAVATATAAVGISLWLSWPIGLAAALVLGAAVATTDPGAVISTFREIGAPRRLLVILEGESLLNDAAAIAIFGLLIGIISNEITPSITVLAVNFTYSFGAGAAVGLVVAFTAGWIYPLLVRSTVAEVSLTVTVAYGSYIAAEQLLGGSGVVAVVFAGLATGSAGFLRMGPGNWLTVRAVWTQIGFWSNALIMMLATSLMPSLIAQLGWLVAPLTALVYVGAMASRATILFGVLPLLARVKLTAPLDTKHAALVLWGGVRGSVTLVLAISIADLPVLGEDGRLLAGLAASYTLVTIFLNAGTLAALTRRLGLNDLTPADLALRERIVSGSLEQVRSAMRNFARARELEPEALQALELRLEQQQRKVEALAVEQAEGQRIPFGERLRLGLGIVSGQEARLIRRAFDTGAIGPRVAGVLRLDADRLADAARNGGREQYEAVTLEVLRPTLRYRVALWVQLYLRLDRPLREAIELHFGKLLESERLVRELKEFVSSTVAPMIGEDAARNLAALLETRHEAVNDEIEAIAVQYPLYAARLEENLIARAAVRREREQYARLLHDGVVGQELYDDLTSDLDSRERGVAVPPRLDLTLTPRGLLDRVPLFAGLDEKQRRMVVRRLRTRFTTPGEVILQKGLRGTEMFFIASGAFEVEARPENVTLGTGDFFGEIALIQPLRRRQSSVVSLGYCRVLVLRRRDFQKLARRDPSLEQLIRGAAERQLSGGYLKPMPLVLPDAAE